MSLQPVVVLAASDFRAVHDHLLEALASPQAIAPLPRVCAQLAELTAQQAPDAVHLSRLIQSDPALAGEVMRVANSPALRPRASIVSLQQAVSWLGVAEVRNIATAVMLRGEVFVAPGHDQESEELWREAWLAALWAKEVARERRRHVESAFLAALMHRTGAALALKVLSAYEQTRRITVEPPAFAALVVEYEPRFGRLLMENWRMSADVQDAASGWRAYDGSVHADLAGTVHASHLLATHTLHPEVLDADVVLGSEVFEQLGMFPDDRRRILDKREHVCALAGL
jgi:HD-like signal output (HDOD) protein